MSAPDAIVTGGNRTGSTDLTLSGTGVCTGTLLAGPTCDGVFPFDVVSLVTPLELQLVSPVDAVNAIPAADLQYGGVGFDDNDTVNPADDLILFGFSTWGSWSSLTDVAINVCIDPDENGTYDRLVVGSNFGTLAAQFGAAGPPPAQDTFVRGFLTLPGGTGGSAGGAVNVLGPNIVDTRVLDNNVMFMAATPSQLNLTLGGTDATPTAFRYKVVTCPGFNPFCTFPNCAPAPGARFDEAGPFFYDYSARGLDFGPFAWLLADLDGSAIPVSWNLANLAANGSLGGLLLHHHNVEGQRAEPFAVVSEAGTGTADLRVSNAVTGTQTVGNNVTFTVTVTNDGPETASGVVVAAVLPSGLTYVSDDGLGGYDQASGLWTLPAPLANGGSVVLSIVATIDGVDEACTLAQISAGTPLDGDPSDNQAEVCVAAARQANLAVGVAASVSSVPAGDPVTLTIDLDNLLGDPPAASQTAYGVNVAVSFPGFPDLTMSGVPTGGTFDDESGIWSLASLKPGDGHQLTVTVDAPLQATVLTAEAAVTSSLSDPDTGNDADSASVNVISGYFYTLTPCRILDTRQPEGDFGGPPLAPSAGRDFDAVASGCGIPAKARALAVNVTAVSPGAPGFLVLFPQGEPQPPVSNLNFSTGKTRANNAIVLLKDGAFRIVNGSAGTTDVIVDVVGYFN